ncbi:MAG: hypothetical protein KC503_20620 [Myxococcales bacterium]|nr:hypothetical protein [Myxococcales bacterium]
MHARRRRRRCLIYPIGLVVAALLLTSSVAAASKRPSPSALSRYREAQEHFKAQRFDDAYKGFAAVVTHWSGQAVAGYSADLLLDCLNRLKRYVEMERWVDRLLRMQSIATGQRLIRLHRLKVQLLRHRAEQLEKRKQHSACAATYLGAYRKHRRYSRAPAELLYNAAVCLRMAGQSKRALVPLTMLVHRHARSQLVGRALLRIADAEIVAKRPARAARAFFQYGQRFPGERDAPSALLHSVQLYMKAKARARARAAFRLMSKLYARREPRLVARARAALSR